ncbi:YndM family protein [Ureibacillus aquaedulcis]|uniref:YndM family protein n=1 Tax=Ureibacillus aquaedulcis TaxID=3058421 RepID=A0ABT8GKI3_9BACL|nr:YndM family protein [Ureibacillus sp. BA0131]MDN4491933.1 YndM family protein [Ureibacillus sp. BA0131]
MQYTKAFLVKLAMTIVVLWIVLGLFYGVSFGNILLISAILTIIAFVGDVFLLPKVGNFIAATSDLFLAFFVIWGLGTWLFGNENTAVFAAAFLSALFIGVGEMFYHRYFRDHVMETVQEPEKHQGYTYSPRIAQTEYSQEFDEGLEKRENNDITKSENEDPMK